MHCSALYPLIEALPVLTLTLIVTPLIPSIAIACKACEWRAHVLAGISLGIFDLAARTVSTAIHVYVSSTWQAMQDEDRQRGWQSRSSTCLGPKSAKLVYG